jgi:tetratricopeptide (TPR) repeat protein
MNNPAVLYGLFLLFFVGMGEVFLWWEPNENLPKWKLRAMIFGLGVFGSGAHYIERTWKIRVDLMLYGAMLISLVVVCICLAVLKRLTASLNRLLMQSQEMQNVGQTSEAITLLTNERPRVARMGKESESLLLTELARLSLAVRRPAAAEEYLREAEIACPRNQAVYTNRAELLAMSSDLNGACDALKSGLEKLPKSAWLNTELAERLANAGRHDEAREALARTIELMETEKFLDVADPEEWREKRIGPLVQRLNPATGQDSA